jgi:stringent starvation protein B
MNFDNDSTSTRPYLIRALFEWCVDQGLTPYLLVVVNENVRVPKEFIKNGEIVLNISPEATGGLQLGNEWIEFKARFGGVAREIFVPVEQVVAIYAKENAQGMAFPRPNANANVNANGKGQDRVKPKPKSSAAGAGLSIVGAEPSSSSPFAPHETSAPSAWSKMLSQVGLKSVPPNAELDQESALAQESTLAQESVPSADQSSEASSSRAADAHERRLPTVPTASSLPQGPAPTGAGPGASHLKRIK